METPPRKNPFLKLGSLNDTFSDLRDLNDSSDRKILYSLTLKEFSPLTHILSIIPAQAQRGLSKFDIEFVSLDAQPKWIAIGSSIGTVFLYNRHTGELTRLRYQDYIGKITSVKFSSSSRLMLAYGTESGLVLSCQIPDYDSPPRKLECIPVNARHGSEISCLEWSPDGIQLFSGDSSGIVNYSKFDYIKLGWSSSRLLEENCGVVQLAYHPSSILVVSTLRRCILCHLQDGQKYQIYQIGKKDRKIEGEFGCAFDPVSLGANCFKVYAVRPGLRLWKSNLEGVVMETVLLKESCLTARCQPSIQVLTHKRAPPDSSSFSVEGEQFGKTYVFQDLFLLSWNSGAIYIIDPEMRAVVASTHPEDLSNIVDVSCCRDEVFILQGKRNIRRLASSPEEDFHFISLEKAEYDSSQFLSNILGPFQELVKERSASNVFEWLRPKPDTNQTPSSAEEPEAMLAKARVDLPPVLLLPEKILDPVLDIREGPPLTNISDNQPPAGISQENIGHALFTSNCASEDEEDEMVDSPVVVYKMKKARKKHGRMKKPKETVEQMPLNTPCVDTNPSSFFLTKQTPPVTLMSHFKEKQENEDDLLAHILGSYNPLTNKLQNVEKENTEAFELQVQDRSKKTEEQDGSEPVVKEKGDKGSPGFSKPPTLFFNEEVSSSSAAEDSQQLDQVLSSPEPDIYVDNVFSEKPKLKRELDVSKLTQDSLENSAGVVKDCDKEEWVLYKPPSTKITSISASKLCLYVTDSNSNLFYSLLKGPGLHWYTINQSAEQVAVSPSGTFLWALNRQSAYVVQLNVATGDPKGKWTEAAQKVSQIALDDHCAWLVKHNGELRVQQKLSGARPCYKTQKVNFSMGTPTQLTCSDGVLWILNQKGKLYVTSLSSAEDISSPDMVLSWREIIVPELIQVSVINLGHGGTGWIVETNGKIWFKEGITSARPQGQNTFWQVSVDVTTQRTWKSSSSSTETAPLLLTSSDKGLWMHIGNLLWASRGNVTGHKWDKIKHDDNWISLASSESYQGALWILSHVGELHCLPSRQSAPLPVPFHPEVIRSGSFPVCLAPSSTFLWLLCDSGSVWSRTGISPPACVQGTGWASVDLSQIGDCKLVHISCGKDVVWACDSSGMAWIRIGPLSPTKQGLEPAWIMAEDMDPDKAAIQLLKIFVNGNGCCVWGIERRTHAIYVREGVKMGFPIGKYWVPVPGLQAQTLALSDNAVYAVSLYGAIFKRVGAQPSGNAGSLVWKQLNGVPICQSISVTPSDELFVLDKSGRLLQYVSTTVIHHTEGSVHQPILLDSTPQKGEVTDEGWEMIETVN